jgi:hypothetical protein
MAAKTSVFYLTERLTTTSATADVTDTIDLGAYVDVADRQGILVHSVDFIVQGEDTTDGSVTHISDAYGAVNADVLMQLTDLNRGQLVFADDRSLIASGNFMFSDANNTADMSADIYPDNFGPTSAQGGRIVINDQMYVRARNTGTLNANRAINIIVRIKASVITLSQKDFMAIALQSTAADN